MTEKMQKIWQDVLENNPLLKIRPSYLFDPVYYAREYSDIGENKVDPFSHFDQHGREEGRFPNTYKRMLQVIPDLNDRLHSIARDPRIVELLEEGIEDACELLYELVLLGEPFDRDVSDFSSSYYLDLYPDIANIPVSPFHHFIQSGITEKRRTLRSIRDNFHNGLIEFDPDKPTCLVCVHEFSKSGAPIVGLDIAREARETHNVIIAALRGGALLDAFREQACAVMVTERPAEDFAYFTDSRIEDIDFAILNSVECYLFTKLLVDREVPFAVYLHEYTNYTFPAYKTIFSALFSDILVFSSDQVRDSWIHVLDDMNFDIQRDSCIVPQADLSFGVVSVEDHDAARQRLSRLIGRDITGKRVVFGAGHAQWRKGTDMFVMTAQIARQRDPDTLFVWIGDGLNHEDVSFGVWLDKHMTEAGVGTPDANLFFLPAGSYYPDVCMASDVMFLSSRLDPLPNVVFDAVRVGCRVVMFDGASGFGDPAYTRFEALSAVEYGNLQEAADTLLDTPMKTPGELAANPTAQEIVPIFDRIRIALQDRLAAQRSFAVGRGECDVPVLFSNKPRDAESRVRERNKFWTYDRRMVWRSSAAAATEIARSDSWVHRNMQIARYETAPPPETLPDFSIHIHAYYTDDMAQDLDLYLAYHHARRIVVTTDSERKADTISRILEKAGLTGEVVIGSNQGRDILPFMRLFSEGQNDAGEQTPPVAGNDEIWCHLHQKKSLSTTNTGDVWRAFLLTILLGDQNGLSSALLRMADPNCGLVTAFDPYNIGWAGSRRLLGNVQGLPGPLPDHPLLFPVGNMFWTRAAVVQQMNGLFGPDYPWPNEPIANDGTVFHLIERLWPTAATMAGLGSVFVEKRDQARN